MTVRASSPVSVLWRDAVAGIAAAAVLMTQAMAFGIALYEPYLGAGALAGLIGVAGLSLLSSLSRGTAGLISGPTGPVLALLVVISAALASSGLGGAGVVQGLAVVVVMAGAIQVLHEVRTGPPKEPRFPWRPDQLLSCSGTQNGEAT